MDIRPGRERTLLGDPGRVALLRLGLANAGYTQAGYLSLLIILPGRAAVIGGRADKTLVLAVVVAAGAVIALPAGIVAGRLSDRRLRMTGSRRPLLAVVAAIGAVLLAVLPLTGSAAALLLAYGRDIGVMNAAISAPQVAAAALAAALLGAYASYHLLFAAGAVITVAGAAFVLPIRRVG